VAARLPPTTIESDDGRRADERPEEAVGVKVVVCDGDETGQELLDAAVRVLDAAVLGIPIALQRFDLSLANRRRTENRVVYEAADAMLDAGLGLKAATITPTQAGDVGSPNRILRERVGGSVIVRTGRRIPGVSPLAPVVHPIVVVRMAVGDAYGAEEARTGLPGAQDEGAYRTERIERATCYAVAEYSFVTADAMGAQVYGGPKWTVSPVYEGLLKEEMDAAAARHPQVRYRPTLVDAAYAGLLTESAETALVIPALNRDGDCLSDLVLALFGSIAGAESVLLALDGCDGRSAPRHGTVARGKGCSKPDGDASRVCCRFGSCRTSRASGRGARRAGRSRRDVGCRRGRCPDVRSRWRSVNDAGRRRGLGSRVVANACISRLTNDYLCGAVRYARRSMMVALAIPPPSHIVWSP
jgi:isocitrate dehydrogenase (NAD+)